VSLLCLSLLASLFSSTPVCAAPNELRVAYHTQSMPYSHLDESGMPRGMFIDLMDWLGAEVGRKIVYVPFSSNSACCNALDNGSVDVVLGTLSTMGEWTEFQRTSAISTSALCLVVPADEAKDYEEKRSFVGVKAAYEYGTASSSSLYNLHIKQYISCGSQQNVLDTLERGRAKVGIMAYDSAVYLLNQEAYKDKYTIIRNNVGSVSYVLLLRAEDHSMGNRLDSAIVKAKTSGIYEEVAGEWLPSEQDVFNETLRRLGYGAAICASVALAIIIFVSVTNRFLSRRVAEKTAELEAANRELDAKILALENDSRLRRDIIERSHSGMVAFDGEGRITLINQAAMSLAGLGSVDEENTIHTIPLWRDLYKKMRERGKQVSERTLLAGLPQEIELETDGHLRKYRCSLMRGSSANDGELLMSAEDITKEDRERQLLFEQEKNLYLNRFVAGIAHEIKNPLMSIRTAATLMRDMPDDPEVQQAVVRFVPDEVDRINHLVEGLVQYARPVKGHQTIFEISSVVEECRYLVDISAKKHPIRCQLSMEEGLAILANRDKVKQSLINIIMNGLESMEERLAQKRDRELTMSIQAKGEGSFVVVTVRDEGMGMDEEKIKNCFNPFFTTKETGTGLGLTLVRQYLTENGGHLFIESRPGEFTQITLTFRRYLRDEA